MCLNHAASPASPRIPSPRGAGKVVSVGKPRIPSPGDAGKVVGAGKLPITVSLQHRRCPAKEQRRPQPRV